MAGQRLGDGECLLALAEHFLAVWGEQADTRKIRERDGHRCQVPGCSRRAGHAHHIQFRSQQGPDNPRNLVSLCAAHHSALHHGYLRVRGCAPHRLTWELGERVTSARRVA